MVEVVDLVEVVEVADLVDMDSARELLDWNLAIDHSTS